MTWLALVAGLVIGVALASLVMGRQHRRERQESASVRTSDDASSSRSESSRVFRALNAVPLGIMVFERRRPVFANAFAHQFDSGRHTDVLVERAIAELVARASAEGAVDHELDLYGPPRRRLSLRALPLAEMSNDGMLVTIEDVSERHRIEEVRRDFVANVSHELKTPVGAIGVLAETLSAEDDPDIVSRLSGRLHDEAHRLGTTIDDLLTLSTIESGETFQTEPIVIGNLVNLCIERVRAAAELNDVSITASVEDDLRIDGDRRQLESALSNLLDNAVKYSDAGTDVVVQAARDEEWIDIAVTDAGHGVPERDLTRIFERFYRVDQARSRATGGTGLGLSIVRHVAINHGGDVTVRSTEGVGSTFQLRLPAVNRSVANERSPSVG